MDTDRLTRSSAASRHAHVRHHARGGGCNSEPLESARIADAASTALRTADALDAHDEPVPLIARVERDLSEHGLVYSHAGFAVRDHASGRWSVVHLLNECGTHASGSTCKDR